MSYGQPGQPNYTHPLASLSHAQPVPVSTPQQTLHAYPPLPVRALGGATLNAFTHSPESNASPQASGSGNGVNGKRPRNVSGQAGVGSEDEDEEKRKRNRQALSCSSCKRKKIKCDRKIPCEACIRRGKPQDCSWAEAKIEPEPQLFALNADLKRVASRLMQVEQFLQTLPPELRAGAPRPQQLTVFGKDSPAPDLYSPDHLRLLDAEHTSRHDADVTSDTEDAAVSLEAAAFGTQRIGGQQFAPADSLPFFDTSAPKSARTYRAELTRELTSIIAPAINPDAGPSCSIQLGLDFGIPIEEVEAARRAAVGKVLHALPDKQSSYFLVAQYFEDFDWIHHTVHKKSFDAELDRFWEMHAAGRATEVCPLWLALYSMILALSLDGMRARPNTRTSVDDNSGQALKWFAAAQRLLILGDWLGAPQARSIMTVILLGQYIQIASFGGQANRFLGWLASAIRIAQIMGLHQLGDNPEHMPPDDPCWPPGKNSVKREGALRLFSILIFCDWLAATTRFPTYMLHTSQFNSLPLSNLNDSDLSNTEWRTSPLPRSMVTDASFEYAKFTIALQSKKVFDKLVSESETFSYATVLELDRGYRQILDQLPDDWKTEHTQKEKKVPQLRWKRHVCQAGIHSRIVRLHRPFLTRGYTAGSRFRFSTESCVASAKIVIATHHNILDVTNNVWFLYNHALGAAIVLFCDLFQCIDNNFTEAEVEHRKETLVAAFEIFGRGESISSPVLRAVVQQGARILSGLFMAAEKRRVTRAARALVGDHATASVESFAQVLQRISRDFDFKSPTPAPVNIERSAAETLAALPAHVPGLSGTTTPYNGNLMHPSEDQNFDQLSNLFFQDLGMPTGAGSGLNFWSQTTPTAQPPLDGPTPPDTYSFLGSTVDWSSIGLNQQPLGGAPIDSNAVAATALLDQLSLPW